MVSAKKELELHPLPQKVFNNVRPVLAKIGHKLEEGRPKIKEKTKLWEHEGYDYEVITNLYSVVSGTQRLQKIQNFIRTFPRPRSYERRGINQGDWIEYHYSYYVITQVSLFDISLILTNSVFRLGNRAQDCKVELIMNNSWVKQTPVKKILEDIEKLVRPHREGRNLHIHRGQIQDIAAVMESDDLGALNILSRLQTNAGHPIIEQDIIDLGYKEYVKEIYKRLQEESGKIQNVMWRFFDSLLPIYDERFTTLREKYAALLKQKMERRKRQKEQKE
jgi:hypothetical protein